VVARAATGVFRPFDRLRTGCGSKERTVFFVRFGVKAAKTNEKEDTFRPAGGENRRLRSPPRNSGK
jgi:hypothetical protein